LATNVSAPNYNSVSFRVVTAKLYYIWKMILLYPIVLHNKHLTENTPCITHHHWWVFMELQPSWESISGSLGIKGTKLLRQINFINYSYLKPAFIHNKDYTKYNLESFQVLVNVQKFMFLCNYYNNSAVRIGPWRSHSFMARRTKLL